MLAEKRDVTDKIDNLLQHFFDYLFTKTVRDISLSANISDKYWDYIKGMESHRSLSYGKRNYSVEEIYHILIPFVEFLKSISSDVLPNLRDIIYIHSKRLNLSTMERSVRNMLLENYEENIYRLGNIVLDIYEMNVAEDLKTHKNKTPLCLTIKEITKLEENLSFILDRRKS